MIQTLCTYQIHLCGAVDEDIFNAKSPLQVKVTQAEPEATLFTVSADQSGLIGLMRHLHGQGFVLLTVHRAADEALLLKADLPND